MISLGIASPAFLPAATTTLFWTVLYAFNADAFCIFVQPNGVACIAYIVWNNPCSNCLAVDLRNDRWIFLKMSIEAEAIAWQSDSKKHFSTYFSVRDQVWFSNATKREAFQINVTALAPRSSIMSRQLVPLLYERTVQRTESSKKRVSSPLPQSSWHELHGIWPGKT